MRKPDLVDKLAWLVGALLVMLVVASQTFEGNEYIIEPESRYVTLQKSTWWGLKKEYYDVARRPGGWYIRTPGGQWDEYVMHEDGSDPPEPQHVR